MIWATQLSRLIRNTSKAQSLIRAYTVNVEAPLIKVSCGFSSEN